MKCYGRAGNCSGAPEYEWTGPHGGRYYLCVACCADWRVQTAATPVEPARIITITGGG